MKRISILAIILLAVSAGLAARTNRGLRGRAVVDETPQILPIRERVKVVNASTRERLDILLPTVMRETGFDMWIIAANEDQPDAVLQTMIPYNTWNRRTQIVVFFDRGPEKGVERLNVSLMNMRGFHKNSWDPRKEGQWECLARIVAERDPRRIGINDSEVIWAADGLSASLKRRLIAALGPRYEGKIQSAEKPATLWLETLLDEEVILMERAVAISHSLIAETYSGAVITPGVTTVDDLIYHYWQRALDLGLEKAFNPSFSIRRGPREVEKYGREDRTIRRGDLIHCDVGVIYLRYYTDHQEWAYVLRQGESDAPESFRKALAEGNKLQNIFASEFKEGLSGNVLLNNILTRAKQEGIPGPRVYSHSLGYFLHEPGPLIGLPEEQKNTGGRGEVRLVPNSAFTAEMSVDYPVPEWDGQPLRLGIEQDVVFTPKGVVFLDGRQTKFHLVR
jgi:Xaa-Pro aminopeptidase